MHRGGRAGALIGAARRVWIDGSSDSDIGLAACSLQGALYRSSAVEIRRVRHRVAPGGTPAGARCGDQRPCAARFLTVERGAAMRTKATQAGGRALRVVRDGFVFEFENGPSKRVFAQIVDGAKIGLAIGIDHPSNNFLAHLIAVAQRCSARHPLPH